MDSTLLRLAADLLDAASNEAASRGCNDYRLPESLADVDRAELAELMNRDNLNAIPRELWPPGDITSAEDLRAGCSDFAVMGALALGLREMVPAAALSAALIEGYTRDHTAFLALLSAMGLRTGATDPCGALKGAVALAEDRARVAEREACAAGPAESAPAHVRRELPGADIAVIGAVVSVVLARDGQWREAIRARGSR